MTIPALGAIVKSAAGKAAAALRGLFLTLKPKDPSDSETAPEEKSPGLLLSLRSSAAAALRRFRERLRKWRGFAAERLRFPRGGKLPPALLPGLAGICVIVAVTLLIAAGRDPKREKKRSPAAEALPAIPGEELFLPEEPDFLPPVLLGREKRDAWQSGDALPFWNDPAEWPDEEWPRRMKREIDRFMETVP